jgi:phosphoethanolamine N-methyltransferase
MGDASVHVVYSSGAFTQIEDKQAMFAEVYRVLKPGGAFIAYDWMKGPDPYSEDMRHWFKMEGLTYAMETLENHEHLLTATGFQEVEIDDDGGAYRQLCHEEYERMKGPLNAGILELLGEEQTAHFLENWRAMTVVLDKGELRPGFYRGVKPA